MNHRQKKYVPLSSICMLLVCLAAWPGTCAAAERQRSVEQYLAAKPALPWQPTKLRVANIFASHMVLQRDITLPVWGTAPAGTKVTVAIDDQKHQATTDKRGWWMVMLEPLKLGKPRAMTVTAGEQRMVLEDILVGDVWLFSGQSNMTHRVNQSDVGDDLKNNPKRFDLPNLRMFQVGPHPGMKPTADLSRDATWTASNAEAAKGMSAIAWTTCERLVRESGVPIGLLQVECGGSHIEAWLSRKTLTSFEHGKYRYDRYYAKLDESLAEFHQKLGDLKAQHEQAYQQREREMIAAMRAGEPWPRRISEVKIPGERRAAIDPRRGRSYYTNLYNTMIDPLAPFAIRGAVWYQGEYSQDLGHRYAYYLKLLAAEWRSVFGQGDFPFIVVQLHSGGSGATLREVQLTAPKYIANTYVATAADVGNGLHTPEKQEVGRRVAGVALREVYGKDTPAYGPIFREAKVEADGRVRVYFDHAEGLKTRDGKAPVGFRVLYRKGSRMKSVEAQAKIDGDTVIVWNPEVKEPVGAAFGQSGSPNSEMTLINRHGLPAFPFTSDREWLDDFEELGKYTPRRR